MQKGAKNAIFSARERPGALSHTQVANLGAQWAPESTRGGSQCNFARRPRALMCAEPANLGTPAQ
eukprot:277782-Pyramimonas_sp.AAC.1